MFFENSTNNFEVIIARSADLTNKPYIHSVVRISGDFDDIFAEEINLSVNIICRDVEGNRIKKKDIELELFKSNSEFIIVLAKLHYPDEPILWNGNKSIWMDSVSGKKCNPPNYSFALENLANRIRSLAN